ncbi:MAG: hypothetical protein GC185_07765 [Alphaproteobacteria bacterium]|nr:hypothetical protein [Alphaproteobacteria bacterium]
MKYIHVALIILQGALGAAAANDLLSSVITDETTLGKVVAGLATLQLIVKSIDGYFTANAVKAGA